MSSTDLHPIAARLTRLRSVMHQQQIDALLIPSADPHLSEYLPARWQGREWLSGFTGSVGTLIVTPQFAGLWTDARYWTQAEQQLAGTGISLMKLTSGASIQYVDWLAATMQAGQTVAVDGNVLGLAIGRQLSLALQANDVRLRTQGDLLEQVWEQRPAMPLAPVYPHLPPYATVSRADKLASLRAAMQQLGGGLDDAQRVADFMGQAHRHFAQGMQAVAAAQLGFEVMQLAQALGHVVESAAQLRQFIAAADGHAVLVIAGNHRIHAFGQVAQGPGQAA